MYDMSLWKWWRRYMLLFFVVQTQSVFKGERSTVTSQPETERQKRKKIRKQKQRENDSVDGSYFWHKWCIFNYFPRVRRVSRSDVIGFNAIPFVLMSFFTLLFYYFFLFFYCFFSPVPLVPGNNNQLCPWHRWLILLNQQLYTLNGKHHCWLNGEHLVYRK